MTQGFDDGVNTVWESPKIRMRQVIKDLCGEANKDRKLYIAGHSLGGALATVAAARVAFEEDLDIAAVYTIGSPKYVHGMRRLCSFEMCRTRWSGCRSLFPAWKQNFEFKWVVQLFGRKCRALGVL